MYKLNKIQELKNKYACRTATKMYKIIKQAQQVLVAYQNSNKKTKRIIFLY